MNYKELLNNDLKQSMKDKDTIKKNTVQAIRTAILQVEKDQRIVLEDDQIIDIIAKELKKRRDSTEDFAKSGREDLIENLNKEIDILVSYLPEQLSEDELKTIIIEAIKETNASSMKDMKNVMAIVTPKTKGKADSKLIAQIIKENLK